MSVGEQLETTRARHPDGHHSIVDVHTDADVVVLQRPMARDLAELIPVLQRRGTAVVVEIDDDFHALPKGHPARRATSVGANPDHNRRWLRLACERADLVTCTTPALADRYATHCPAAVIPNYVPESWLGVKGRHHARTRIGWTGSAITHIGDLETITGPLRDVIDHMGATFVALPSALEIVERPGEEMRWRSLTGSYPSFVAGLDVGVVPLVDNEFNRAKSWVKGIEYAALGVPFVASDVAEYARLVARGAGAIARSPEEWRRALTSLVASQGVRDEMAGRGREAAARLTIEGNAERWADAWRQAADRRATVTA